MGTTVQKWIEDINAVTRISYDLTNGSTLQEINYWLSFERSLNLIDQQIKLPEVDMTLQILKAKRRFSITTTFENDLEYSRYANIYDRVAEFMREFPINDLLSASSPQDLIQALQNIFNHMRRITTIDGYKTQRCFQLIETVDRDLNIQLRKTLSDTNTITCDFDELAVVMESAKAVFNRFNEQYNNIRNSLRNARADAHKFVCNFTLVPLQERLQAIYQFRREHEQLREVIENITGSQGVSKTELSFLSTKDIQDAYSVFLNIDVLDISTEGEARWQQARKAYDLKIDRVESVITSKLRDKLGSASNANEMFRIFAKFNALFFRPHIRGAIQEYQNQLLRIVQRDIKALKEKYLKYNQDAALITKVRDIPAYAGKLIWMRQINRKLKQYMDKVETILGKNWTNQPEGKELKELGDNFEKNLNFANVAENNVKEM